MPLRSRHTTIGQAVLCSGDAFYGHGRQNVAGKFIRRIHLYTRRVIFFSGHVCRTSSVIKVIKRNRLQPRKEREDSLMHIGVLFNGYRSCRQQH